MSEGAPSRVAIKFGASLSSAPKKPSRGPPPSALGKRQRNRFDADSESEEEDASAGKHQSITGFGADGAEVEDGRRRRSRRDGESEDDRNRRHRSDRPRDSRPQHNGDKDVDPPDEEKPIKWGLTVTKRSSEEPEQAPAGGDKERKDDDHGEDQEKKPPKTADEEAMDALLGKNGDDADRRRLLVHRTEDDAYQEATRDAPDVDKLEVYEDFPVDGFGASLLRGQGWDGQMRGPKIKEVQRRPNQMGLGAKKLKGEEDLGAWNQKSSSDKRPRLDDYKRDKERERSRREERHRDSYKRERDRDRDRDRDHDRGGSHRHRDRDYR